MSERYIYDKIAKEVVTAEVYEQRQASRNRLDGASKKRVHVQSDIEPYRSILDDSVIGSRSQHRTHLRDHNAIEVGNEAPKWMRDQERERNSNGR